MKDDSTVSKVVFTNTYESEILVTPTEPTSPTGEETTTKSNKTEIPTESETTTSKAPIVPETSTIPDDSEESGGLPRGFQKQEISVNWNCILLLCSSVEFCYLYCFMYILRKQRKIK